MSVLLRQSPAGKNVSMEPEDTVEFRRQAAAGEDTVDWEDLVCAVVIYRVYVN
jgi:hypothetical protein